MGRHLAAAGGRGGGGSKSGCANEGLTVPRHPPACLEELLEAKTSELGWIEGWQGRIPRAVGNRVERDGKVSSGSYIKG